MPNVGMHPNNFMPVKIPRDLHPNCISGKTTWDIDKDK